MGAPDLLICDEHFYRAFQRSLTLPLWKVRLLRAFGALWTLQELVDVGIYDDALFKCADVSRYLFVRR